MLHWYLLQSKPKQEQVAYQNLCNQGYTSFLPTIARQKIQRGVLTTKSEPLFNCYLFVRLDPDGGLFIMERFDRTADGQKFGLEDMVVLMGKTPNEKYHGSYESIAKAIDLYCGEHAAESKARFFEYLAVSTLLKNGDAHLKNFSLLYDVPTGTIKLSPLYDVVTTIIYQIVNPKTGATKVDNSMALQMFKQKSFPVNAELIRFGKSVCMVSNPQDVIERIEEAKHFVMRKHANEMDPGLIAKLKMAWRIYAIHTNKGSRAGISGLDAY